MHEDNRSLGLFLDSTEVMNQPNDYVWLTHAICVFSIMVNVWSMKVLTTRDDHCITRLVNWDCVSNILISVEALLFNLDVGFPLNLSVICAIRNATVMSLSTFTRLVPVAIVVLRYISVCHPALFIKWGKEKGVWKWILGPVIVLCLAVWIYNLYTSSIHYRFLRCVGREEAFW